MFIDIQRYSMVALVAILLSTAHQGQCQNSDPESVKVPGVKNFESLRQYLNSTYGAARGLRSGGIVAGDWPGALCNRECGEYDFRICYFELNMELFHAMGAACGDCKNGVINDCFNRGCVPVDGVERGIMTFNRRIPAPSIQVCKDDLIVVNVKNYMAGFSATIHWHGLHQVETPWMDGVPFLTQCPIEYSTSFTYVFWASQPGTQWFHSHSGYQRVNGQYGALIIRQPYDSTANAELYDYDLPEHYILLSDWMHETAEMFVPGLPSRPPGILPETLLINGHGQWTDPATKNTTKTPLARFKVRSKRRYRFRIINAGSHICPFTIQVENHRMTVISSDSFDVEPLVIDTLLTAPGERYDVIIKTNKRPGDYFIRVRSIGFCESREIETFAILSYDDGYNSELKPIVRKAPKYSSPYPVGVYLNNPNSICFYPNDDQYCVSDLRSVESDEQLRTAIPDKQFFISFENYPVQLSRIYNVQGEPLHFMNLGRQTLVTAALNNNSFHLPSFPPLTQPENIDQRTFCDERQKPAKCRREAICECSHRLKMKLNDIVELIIVDETSTIGPLHHPFHVHGYRLMTTNMGQDPLIPMTKKLAQSLHSVQALPQSGKINYRPPFKDTVGVPSRGYIVIRFRANNPGFWFMHCHFEWHMETGMALILQVGEIDEMVEPPRNFPKCGNYKPDLEDFLQY